MPAFPRPASVGPPFAILKRQFEIRRWIRELIFDDYELSTHFRRQFELKIGSESVARFADEAFQALQRKDKDMAATARERQGNHLEVVEALRSINETLKAGFANQEKFNTDKMFVYNGSPDYTDSNSAIDPDYMEASSVSSGGSACEGSEALVSTADGGYVHSVDPSETLALSAKPCQL